MFYSGDDMMNMYARLGAESMAAGKSLLMIWMPIYRPLGGAVYRIFYAIFGFHPAAALCLLLAAAGSQRGAGVAILSDRGADVDRGADRAVDHPGAWNFSGSLSERRHNLRPAVVSVHRAGSRGVCAHAARAGEGPGPHGAAGLPVMHSVDGCEGERRGAAAAAGLLRMRFCAAGAVARRRGEMASFCCAALWSAGGDLARVCLPACAPHL